MSFPKSRVIGKFGSSCRKPHYQGLTAEFLGVLMYR